MQRFRSRHFGWLIALLVAALLTPVAGVLAQDGTPAGGEVIRSQTREEVTAEIEEALGYENAQVEGGTFVDSSISDVQSLNPFLAEEAVTINVTGLIFDSLIGGDPRTGQPAPIGLADSWEV